MKSLLNSRTRARCRLIDRHRSTRKLNPSNGTRDHSPGSQRALNETLRNDPPTIRDQWYPLWCAWSFAQIFLRFQIQTHGSLIDVLALCRRDFSKGFPVSELFEKIKRTLGALQRDVTRFNVTTWTRLNAAITEVHLQVHLNLRQFEQSSRFSNRE